MSRKDIGLKVFPRRPENDSDSAENSDLGDSRRCISAQTQTEFSKDEADGFNNTLLNTSDEKHNVSDMDRAPLGSLEDISSGNFIRNRQLQSKRRKSLLTRHAPPLKSFTTRSASLLDPQEECSTSNACPSSSLDGPLTSSDSSSNLPERASTENAFTDPLEGPSSRTVHFSDSGEGSVMNVCQKSSSETEINEMVRSGRLTELDVCWDRAKAWLGHFLRLRTRQFRNSVYLPLFQVALLALPYSAGYMGLRYSYFCQGCPRLPVLMYVYALLGAFIIILRIAAVLSRRYFAPHLTGREFRNLTSAFCVFYFFFHGIAMMTTYICEPNFIHPGSKKFCIKIFYDYAYIVNIVFLLVFLLMCLIHIPAVYDPSEIDDFDDDASLD